MLGYKKADSSAWVEYHWSLNELKKKIKKAGFIVTDSANVGFKSALDSIFSRYNSKFLINVFTSFKKSFTQ